MARRKRYRRLDRRDRGAIEHGLDRRESCRSIASALGRSPSTVHDEVVRNRVVTRGPGTGGNVSGTDGRDAGGGRVCPRLLSWPFCRGGCPYRRYGHCSYRCRCEYLATDADAFAELDKVEPGRGVDMDRASFEVAVSLIRADLTRGLSPQQIARARAEGGRGEQVHDLPLDRRGLRRHGQRCIQSSKSRQLGVVPEIRTKR